MAGMEAIHLFTDMDRTVIANGVQPESEKAAALFTAFCAQDQVTLVYVSGRHLDSVRHAMDKYQLPRPDFIVCDVGTRIYSPEIDAHARHNAWILHPQWDARLKSNWSYEALLRSSRSLAAAQNWPLQEVEKQSSLKISFYTQAVLLPGQLERFRRALSQFHCQVVWSVDERNRIGLLDVLPENADKRQAIEFLAHQVAHVDLGDAVFAGDSDNDAAVLTGPMRGIVVANADESFKRRMLTKARENGYGDSVYVAKGGFLQMNGCYRAGVLEGIAHYYPSWRGWFSRWMDEATSRGSNSCDTDP